MSAAGETRARRRDLNNQLFAAILGSVLILLLSAVVLVLVANAVYLAQAKVKGVGSGWALFWWGLRDPENHFAIKLSFLTASLATLFSLVVGIPAAYVLSRYRLPGSGLIDTILDLPIVIPPPVMGMSLLIFFWTSLGRTVDSWTPQFLVDLMNAFFSAVLGRPIQDGTSWVFTTRGIVMAQFFVVCSFAVRVIKASFDTIGTRHEDVARTLGCTRAQAFFRVVLPMARSGIVAGGVITWARAVAEFGPVLFFSGAMRWTTEVMPIAMFLHYSAGGIEQAVALVIIMILISTVTLLTFKKLGGQGYLW